MHSRWKVPLAMAVAVAGTLWLIAPAMAQTPAPKVPAAHKAITEYKGSQTCAPCHPNAAKEMAASLHYQQAGVPEFVEGWPEGKQAGMMVSF